MLFYFVESVAAREICGIGTEDAVGKAVCVSVRSLYSRLFAERNGLATT